MDHNGTVSVFHRRFPYPGTLDAAGRVTLKEVEIERVKYEQVVRDLIVDLKLSYHELAYLQRARQVTEQNQQLLRSDIKNYQHPLRFWRGNA